MTIVEKINSASYISEIFPDLTKFDEEYKKIISEIHPDKCSDPMASEATAKVNNFRSILLNGQMSNDDSGELKYYYNKIVYTGDANMLKSSKLNYDILKKKMSDKGIMYLPQSMEFVDETLVIPLDKRAIPLCKLGTMEQKHVNWILSRIIEFTLYMNQAGYTHNGLTPESIFVVPETHGIIVASFYHVVPLVANVKTISGRYKNFYPPALFADKRSRTRYDVETAKRIAAYLLGDLSGSGTVLRKTHNIDFVNFILSVADKSSLDTYKEYRNMLAKNFKTEFHVFNI